MKEILTGKVKTTPFRLTTQVPYPKSIPSSVSQSSQNADSSILWSLLWVKCRSLWKSWIFFLIATMMPGMPFTKTARSQMVKSVSVSCSVQTTTALEVVLAWCFQIDGIPLKTHYFEKVLDVSAFSTDCPVCRKSLISGIVDSIYRCKVCNMYCHGNCRERAKHILKCNAMITHSKDRNNEALSEKVLRQIKKDALLIYDKPIGCL